MTIALDLELARQNLEQVIAATRAQLADLEGELAKVTRLETAEFQSVLNIVSKFGKRRPAKKENGDGAVNADQGITENVLALINTSGRSLRADDLMTELAQRGITTTAEKMNQLLSRLTVKGRIRRYATGVYGPLTPKDTSAPAAVAPLLASGNGHNKKLSRTEYFAMLEGTINRVFLAHKEHGEPPMNMPEITKRVIAAGFPFPKNLTDKQMAVARIVRTAKVKRHGIGPHTTYSL